MFCSSTWNVSAEFSKNIGAVFNWRNVNSSSPEWNMLDMTWPRKGTVQPSPSSSWLRSGSFQAQDLTCTHWLVCWIFTTNISHSWRYAWSRFELWKDGIEGRRYHRWRGHQNWLHYFKRWRVQSLCHRLSRDITLHSPPSSKRTGVLWGWHGYWCNQQRTACHWRRLKNWKKMGIALSI